MRCLTDKLLERLVWGFIVGLLARSDLAGFSFNAIRIDGFDQSADDLRQRDATGLPSYSFLILVVDIAAPMTSGRRTHKVSLSRLIVGGTGETSVSFEHGRHVPAGRFAGSNKLTPNGRL